MQTSYHTHTRWSDGRDDLPAMMAGAVAAGVDELGISDHYVARPDGTPVAWSMPLDFLPRYVAAIQAAAAGAPLTLRLGLEVDFFPENAAAVAARLADFPFDYLIGSVHFVDGQTVDEDAGTWDALAPAERNALWRGYWERVRQMAASGYFDIAGHLDLPKKFGYRPTCDLTAAETAALDAIAAADMALEINTAGWEKPVAEAYPSLHVLRAAHQRAIPLVITADAHRADALTTHYARARALAREAGYTTQVRYAARRRIAYAL